MPPQDSTSPGDSEVSFCAPAGFLSVLCCDSPVAFPLQQPLAGSPSSHPSARREPPVGIEPFSSAAAAGNCWLLRRSSLVGALRADLDVATADYVLGGRSRLQRR